MQKRCYYAAIIVDSQKQKKSRLLGDLKLNCAVRKPNKLISAWTDYTNASTIDLVVEDNFGFVMSKC